MKTIITSILSALLVILMSNTTSAGGSNFRPLTTNIYIADSDSIVTATKAASPILVAEEEYFNDIPFDTRKISAGYFEAAARRLEPEPYVNDIPFETASIAGRYLPASRAGIYTEPEEYIDDIPFDTSKIAERYLKCDSSRICRKDFLSEINK